VTAGARPQRVLVIRNDRVGDLLLSMPAIRAVREAFPASHITVLASPYNAPVLHGWSVPDRVVLYDCEWPLRHRWRVARDLARQSYDLCLVLNQSLEAYVVARLTGAPARVGLVIARRVLDRPFAPLLLTTRCFSRIEAAVARGLPVPHEIELTRLVLERAGIPWAGDELEVPLEPESLRWADMLIARHFPAGAILAGVHLSPKWLDQGWTIDQVAAMLPMIAGARPEVGVVATYGPGDAGIAERLLATPALRPVSDPAASCRVATGWEGRVAVVPVDFPRWAATLARCRVVVSRSTGSLHLSSALKRPVVAVYAPTRFVEDSQQFAPWRVPSRILRGGPFDRVAPAIVQAVAELLNGT